MPVPLSEVLRLKLSEPPRAPPVPGDVLLAFAMLAEAESDRADVRRQLMILGEQRRRKRHHSETEDGTGNAWDDHLRRLEEDR
jgi:hypothetical protein